MGYTTNIKGTGVIYVAEVPYTIVYQIEKWMALSVFQKAANIDGDIVEKWLVAIKSSEQGENALER